MKISVSECTFSDSSLNSPALSFKRSDTLQFELFGTGQMFGTGRLPEVSALFGFDPQRFRPFSISALEVSAPRY